ncbi:Rieske (2Fe-2S) protein [Brevibacterium rongguiense]|nr:Rieske (2Fe-2S) protein [Brevibacterium rongguiense]
MGGRAVEDAVRGAGVSRRRAMQGAALAGSLVSAGALSACSEEKSDAGPVTLKAAEVPVGSGVVTGGWVVVQPVKGEFHAFSAVCPHQGCMVKTVTKDDIICPCHSSDFSTADGSVKSGPAQSGLAPAKLERSGGELTVSQA